MSLADPDTDQLIDRIRGGDNAAGEQLLGKHRDRLRQVISVRLDRRLVARLDPSDVVQEVLAEAAGKLNSYAEHRPIPFFPWLRQMAWARLVKLHEQHLHAQKRTAAREQQWQQSLPDESAMLLAQQVVASGTSPSHQVMREEMRERVQAALAQLSQRDREILVMRYLEQLSIGEIAAVLHISVGAVKTRHFRALNRLRDLLGSDFSEDQS